MVVVPCQIVLIDEQIMIPIQFPEFAINYVKMFVTEIGHDLIDILLLFQQLKDLIVVSKFHNVTKVSCFFRMDKLNYLQQIRSPQFRYGNPSRPTTIDAIKYSSNDCVNCRTRKVTLTYGQRRSKCVRWASLTISWMKFRCFLQKSQSRMRINDILNHCNQIFG